MTKQFPNSTSYTGLDYSIGEPVNRDLETGIRYGVICSHRLMPEAVDEFELIYPDPECECGKPVDTDELPYTCACGAGLDDCYWDGMEAIGQEYKQDGYEATIDSYNDVMIVKSPYFTYAQFCSPCAPGACHLENPLELQAAMPMSNRAYCFDKSWFEGGKAPYPVFSVETGALVEPNKE